MKNCNNKPSAISKNTNYKVTVWDITMHTTLASEESHFYNYNPMTDTEALRGVQNLT